jgi:hypothetical protein
MDGSDRIGEGMILLSPFLFSTSLHGSALMEGGVEGFENVAVVGGGV